MSESLAVRSAAVPVASDRSGALYEALQALADRAERLARTQPDEEAVLTAVRHLPAQAARYAPMPAWVRPELVAAYRAKGIEQLYTHQTAAIEQVRAGRHVVVVTPTASGKTLCYNLPILNAVLENPDTRALYLFPTKALAQDQLVELEDLSRRLEHAFAVYTYDGDTPADARRAIRQKSHLVLTNPDMLHTGILPHHTRWTRLFEHLRFIVLDELHMYRGVFGSHLCNVLRRLRRIARFYGSAPQFLCSSATIANPGELATRLLEAPVEVIEENGAPTAEKFFLFYNPPVVNRRLGIRRSYLDESARVAQEFLRRDQQTILFANSRLHTELLLTDLQQAQPAPPGAAEPVRGYRGGYLPGERRAIERGLREGRIRGVVATNALELGIDIGSLDVAVLAGYPGTIASTWQRAGRAGRRPGASCAVLVASSAPLDQFIIRNPDYFFGRSPEHAYIQPDNLEILVNHLKCAAFELPLSPEETFGRVDLTELCERLAEAGFLHFSGGHWHWTQEAYPADAISLRAVTSDNFVIVDTTGEPEVIGEVDFPSALTTVHPKAIYLHGAEQYHVERLDFAERKAFVRRVAADYYTDAIRYTEVRVLDPAAEARLCRPAPAGGSAPPAPLPALRAWGDVTVRSQVVGFKKIKFFTHETVGAGKLELPENEMHTTAFWFTLERPLLTALPFSVSERQAGLYGLLYALESVATLLLMCDRRDIATAMGERPPAPGARAAVRTPSAPAGVDRCFPQATHIEAAAPHELSPTVQEFFEPNLYLYDAYPGGIGFSEPLYHHWEDLLRQTRQLIAACSCAFGCPSCIGPVGEDQPHARQAALALVDRLLG
ncbi:MAG: DEAD/DEAH box helicase [Firmicutes bacterium]|nr:DEAD/DEAH box helicase [Bacillota bacterium]